MKSIWDILGFVAIVNLVALFAVAGWLVGTDRLSTDRIEATRTLFAAPVSVEVERAREEELAIRDQAEAQEQAASLSDLPVSSDVPIDRAEQRSMHEQVLVRRVERENMKDRRVLEELERRLDARERAFEAKVAAYRESQALAKAAEQEQHFQTAVKLLESLPPRQGKDQILMRAREGDLEKAVAYLRSMRAGARNEIFAAMKTEEELVLASTLLERLSDPSNSAEPLAETVDATLAESSPPS